jgi:hydroxylamine dehydrogenase
MAYRTGASSVGQASGRPQFLQLREDGMPNFRLGRFLAVLLFMGAMATASAAESHGKVARPTRANALCLSCHRTATSYVVSEWERSKHREKGVGCFDCHSSDTSNPAAYEHHGEIISALVSPTQCARCHAEVVKEYAGSIHAKSGLIAQAGTALGGGSYWNIAASVLGWIPWDFSHGMLKKPGEVVTLGGQPLTYQGAPVPDKYWPDLKNNPALEWGTYPSGLDRPDKSVKDSIQVFADWGCLWCHGSTVKIKEKTKTSVTFYPETYPTNGAGRVNPDGSLGSCAACHTAHSTDLAVARSPHTCGRCHESEDHPNLEAYLRSLHGGIYFSTQQKANYAKSAAVPGKDYFGPTCATCHMGAVYDGGKMIYPPTHDPASISMWKFGSWRTTFIRKKGMLHPDVGEVWTKVDPNHGVSLVDKGTAGATEIQISYPSDGLENRKRAMAMCNQCHAKQWTGNFFAVADSSIYLLDHIRAMTFDVEKALQAAGVYTPEDTIIIRNIGAMGVRPTQIMMYHTAPGEVWWDGLMRVSQEFVEYIDTKVTPRLGAEKTKQWVSWIPEYEKRIRELGSAKKSD